MGKMLENPEFRSGLRRAASGSVLSVRGCAMPSASIQPPLSNGDCRRTVRFLVDCPPMATDSSLRPAWIVRREQRKGQLASRAALLAADERLAEMAIESYSGQFCLDFVRELQFNLGCVDGLTCTVKPLAASDIGPQVYTVMVRRQAPSWRGICSTIQFNRPSANSILIHPTLPEGIKDWHIPIVSLSKGEGVGGMWTDQIMPLSAAQIAELVAEGMVEYVDPQ